jgi:hypothetical protein
MSTQESRQEEAGLAATRPTFEIDIVWANGSGTDTGVVEFDKTGDRLVVEYADGSDETYHYGEVVGSRIEEGTQDEDASGIEELVTLTDRKIQIADPDDPETNVIIEPESAPSPDYHWDAMVLDYYHGRPVLCLYEPDKEDSQFTIALPTKDDPNIRPMTTRDIRLDKNVEIVEGDGEEP